MSVKREGRGRKVSTRTGRVIRVIVRVDVAMCLALALPSLLHTAHGG